MPQIKVIHNNFLLFSPKNKGEGDLPETLKGGSSKIEPPNSIFKIYEQVITTGAQEIRKFFGKSNNEDQSSTQKPKPIVVETIKQTKKEDDKKTQKNTPKEDKKEDKKPQKRPPTVKEEQQNSKLNQPQKLEESEINPSGSTQSDSSNTNTGGTTGNTTSDRTGGNSSGNTEKEYTSPYSDDFGKNIVGDFYIDYPNKNIEINLIDRNKPEQIPPNVSFKETKVSFDKSPNINKPEDIKKLKNDLKQKIPLLNLNSVALTNKKPLFIKSYSVHEFLNPYIRCYIVHKKLDDELSFRRNIDKNFFDIPYNMIESFSIEYETHSPINGKFRLILTDTTGIIGNVFTSMLYSLGYESDVLNAIPKINLEFGWSTKGLKRLPKRERNKMLTKNFFLEFLVMNIDMSYDERFKQQVVISGNQEKTGISALLDNPNSKITPYALLGQYPTESLMMLVYHNVLKSTKVTTVDFITDILNKNSNDKSIENAVEEFKKLAPITNILEDINTPVSNVNKLIQLNKFFNSFSFNDKSNNVVSKIKAINYPNIKKQSVFSPFILFAFILNLYVNQILKEESKLDSYILSFISFTEVTWGIKIDEASIDRVKNFDVLCKYIYDSAKNGTNSNKESFLNTNFTIDKNTTWPVLLELLVSKVFIKNSKPPERLYMVHNKYTSRNINSGYEFDDLSKNQGLEYTIKSKDTLLNHIDLIYNSINNSSVKTALDTERKKIKNFITNNNSDNSKKQNQGDFIFFVISFGASFITEDNVKNFLILQQYTVFPKINSSTNLLYQNFNSGKKKIVNESFPDVISFQPKIDFFKVISNRMNHISDIELATGFLTLKDSTISINFLKDNSKELLNLLIAEINNILNTTTSSTIKLTSNDGYYYSFSKVSNIEIKSSILDTIALYPNISSGNGITITAEQKKLVNGDPYKIIITGLENLKDEIEKKKRKIIYGYNYDKLNNIFTKSLYASPADSFSSEFYSYQDLSNRYNLELTEDATNFDAELKILGEPAFTFDFFPVAYILMKVNNFDGSINEFLSGVYRIVKMKHEIEKGNFFTTLSLQYIFESYRGSGKIT